MVSPGLASEGRVFSAFSSPQRGDLSTSNVPDMLTISMAVIVFETPWSQGFHFHLPKVAQYGKFEMQNCVFACGQVNVISF